MSEKIDEITRQLAVRVQGVMRKTLGPTDVLRIEIEPDTRKVRFRIFNKDGEETVKPLRFEGVELCCPHHAWESIQGQIVHALVRNAYENKAGEDVVGEAADKVIQILKGRLFE